MANETDAFARFERKYESWRARGWPRIVANICVRFFRESFERQGWLDKGLSKWPARKGNTDPGRAVLVQRGGGGGLLGSIRPGEVRKTHVQVVAGDERVQYARIHNEGGTIQHPGGSPYIVMKKDGRTQPVYIRKTTAARMGGRVRYTKPHPISMPKRQYMGESEALYDQVARAWMRQMERLWNSL